MPVFVFRGWHKYVAIYTKKRHTPFLSGAQGNGKGEGVTVVRKPRSMKVGRGFGCASALPSFRFLSPLLSSIVVL